MKTRTRKKSKQPLLTKQTEAAKYGDLPPELRNGEISKDMQMDLKTGIFFALLAVLGVAAFTFISFFGAPFILSVLINAWFAGSVIYLAGITYGILNDLIAVRVNLPYFTLGHQPDQRSLIKSNDPNAVAIGWGILATMGPSLIAGALFVTATLITGFIGLPFAPFVLPAIALGIPIALGAAHLFAKYRYAQREKNPSTLKDAKLFLTTPWSPYLDMYQTRRLLYWLKDLKDTNAWLSNSDRNGFGYITMPLLGVVGLASLVTLSAVHVFIPTLLFSSAFAVFPPVGLGLLLATGIVLACAYLYVNRNKQVANGCQLNFPDENKINEFDNPAKGPSNSPLLRLIRRPETQSPIHTQQDEPTLPTITTRMNEQDTQKKESNPSTQTRESFKASDVMFNQRNSPTTARLFNKDNSSTQMEVHLLPPPTIKRSSSFVNK